MFSSVSFGEWTQVAGDKDGNIFYVDFERMRIHNGYRYIWDLTDRIEPSNAGTLSTSTYRQVDCKEFKTKYMQFVLYKQPMGEGSGDSHTSSDEDWVYPPPNSIEETIVKKVCEKEISTK
jgi:hypothetical protein